jgi:hypothetical protein
MLKYITKFEKFNELEELMEPKESIGISIKYSLPENNEDNKKIGVKTIVSV